VSLSNSTGARSANPPEGGPGTLGARLHALRLRAGLSQQEAAERAGISTRALRDIEHGRVVRPQPRTLRRVAEAFGLSGGEIDELVSLVSAADPDGPAAAPSPALRVLGTVTVLHAETPVPLTSPMLHRLLSLLALKHPGPATTDEIVDTLWPVRDA
jgi:transcriptional regulator with XRE-family HTH domain